MGYWISGCKHRNCCDPTIKLTRMWPAHIEPPHKLTRWNKNTFKEHRRYQRGSKPGVTDRANTLHKGTFTECCRALTALTTLPSHHEII